MHTDFGTWYFAYQFNEVYPRGKIASGFNRNISLFMAFLLWSSSLPFGMKDFPLSSRRGGSMFVNTKSFTYLGWSEEGL